MDDNSDLVAEALHRTGISDKPTDTLASFGTADNGEPSLRNVTDAQFKPVVSTQVTLEDVQVGLLATKSHRASSVKSYSSRSEYSEREHTESRMKLEKA